MHQELIENWNSIFLNYKSLGEKAMNQVPDERLFWTFYNDSNSVAMIVQHLSGNMLSRFSNFYEEDGEKPWRNRDKEFEHVLTTREQMMTEWEKGWQCFLGIITTMKPEDLSKKIYIRGEEHSAMQAINRQLAHYSYHIGQMVYLSKMLAMSDWKSLSIPKNKSNEFNENKFNKGTGLK